MAEMSMNKVIHGAVRRDLDRFVVALDHFPAGDRGRAADLAKAWANFDDQLSHHHEGEHRIAWPALQSVGVSSELLTELDTEHDTMAVALTETRAAIAALARSAGVAEASAAREAVARLRVVTCAHLDHEESELEGVYQAKRDTPEIKAMGKAFARDGGPGRGGRFFAWVLDGASVEERRAVTSEVPGPVLTVLTAVFGRGYSRNVAPVWRR